MITDAPPRLVKLKRQFEASDRQVTLAPAPPRGLREAAQELQTSLGSEDPVAVKRAGETILALLAPHYEVTQPPLAVLGVRPHKVADGHLRYELFGDYTPGTKRIRVWMRTAILTRVTSYRGLLNTLLHEFCHHLDVERLGFEDTPHTRGFYARIDELYHDALATPAGARKALHWKKRGSIFMIDWARLRAGKARTLT